MAVRSKMIYVLSHSRDAYWYQDVANFSNQKKHEDTLHKIKTEYDRSDEDFIKAFKNKYSDSMPPCWMMLEVCSFGILSTLYSNLIPSHDKRSIATFFGLKDSVLSSWLHSIVYLRNICAHHSRLWNKEMRIQPLIPRSSKIQFVNQTTYTSLATGLSSPINDKTYFILSMVIYLMNSINPKHTIQAKFKALLIKYPNIDTRAMGFPDDWQNEPLWK